MTAVSLFSLTGNSSFVIYKAPLDHQNHPSCSLPPHIAETGENLSQGFCTTILFIPFSASKQQERQRQLDALPPSFSEGCTEQDNKVLDLSLRELVHGHEAGTLSTSAILQAYGKKLVSAQKATNCLAAVMLDESVISKPPASPTRSEQKSSAHEPVRLLSGVVVSIKDCIDIEGYDTTVGYSSRVNKAASSSASIVRLLRDAGAIIHVKTTVPPGLIGLETSSDLFGRTSNPYNAKFVSGASTGGGAALLASRGSLIEVGTDIGGSVRWPAHCCGIYGMRSSIGRFPSLGALPPLPGQEFVGTSCSPMARRLDDLEEFWKRVVDMNPWDYDHTVRAILPRQCLPRMRSNPCRCVCQCVPLPWRQVDLQDKKLRWGVVWEDGKYLFFINVKVRTCSRNNATVSRLSASLGMGCGCAEKTRA